MASSLLLGGSAVAQEGDDTLQPYATNGKGSVARVNDRSGPCIKTKAWTEELATRECHPELFAEEVVEPSYESLTLQASTLFAFDSAVITEEGKASLQALGDRIQAQGATVVDIDIIGHTDSRGPEAYNQGLSERRAAAMRDFLVSEKGVDPAIIDVSGMGESSPVADNGSEQGRAQNRRVELRIGVKTPN
jgi:outer membrane protein OmpA-like peptidoglycan-associated protein